MDVANDYLAPHSCRRTIKVLRKSHSAGASPASDRDVGGVCVTYPGRQCIRTGVRVPQHGEWLERKLDELSSIGAAAAEARWRRDGDLVARRKPSRPVLALTAPYPAIEQ